MKHARFALGFMLVALLGANNSASAATNYFTELFWGDFDLGGLSIMFEPMGGSDYYEVTEAIAITELPAGIPVAPPVAFLTEWYPTRITVPSGKSVKLYGNAYTDYYISANGNITFGDAYWSNYISISSHFNLPRISTYFCDLDPTTATGGGTVTAIELWSGNGIAVTFEDVPRYGNSSVRCTFQCIMFYGGAIQMAWLHTTDPGSAIVGLSRGDGTPSDYQETNLSAYYAAPPTPNDMDGDGLPDSWEAFYFGSYTNCAPTGHGDSDDYNNESEYIAGTDPTDPSSYFSISCTMNGSQPTPGIVLNWNSITGRTYSIMHNDSLGSSLTNMATGIIHPQNSYTSPIDSAQDSGFFKVNVQMTP
jgi:hypothetical protein